MTSANGNIFHVAGLCHVCEGIYWSPTGGSSHKFKRRGTLLFLSSAPPQTVEQTIEFETPSCTLWRHSNDTRSLWSQPHVQGYLSVFVSIALKWEARRGDCYFYSCPILQRSRHQDYVIKLEHFPRSSAGPFCGEFTDHWWIPHTKASDAELWCFLWSAPWINHWVNIREAGDLRRNRLHYDVIVMIITFLFQARIYHTDLRSCFLSSITTCVNTILCYNNVLRNIRFISVILTLHLGMQLSSGQYLMAPLFSIIALPDAFR